MAFIVRDSYPTGTVGNACYFCRASQRTKSDGSRESVIDPGVNIDFEGFILVCESCATEMAQLLGMLTSVQAEEILNLNRDLVAALESSQEQLNAALSALDSLRSVDTFRAANAPVAPSQIPVQ